MQLDSGRSQAQSIEGGGSILVVAAIGQVMVAQKHMDVRHFSVVYQGFEEAVTGGEHMGWLMGPCRQEITTHNDAMHPVLRGHGCNPGRRLGDAVQVMMLEVNVGQEQPLELCGAHCRDGTGTSYLLSEKHLGKDCIVSERLYTNSRLIEFVPVFELFIQIAGLG